MKWKSVEENYSRLVGLLQGPIIAFIRQEWEKH